MIETVTLEKMKVIALRYISVELQGKLAVAPKVTLHTLVDEMSDEVVLRLVAEIFGQKTEVHEKYPVDWWQALKEQYAPQWFLKRWPVAYKHIDIVARALFPTVNIPGHEATFQIRMMTE